MSRRNEWIPAYAFDTGGSLSLSNEKKSWQHQRSSLGRMRIMGKGEREEIQPTGKEVSILPVK